MEFPVNAHSSTQRPELSRKSGGYWETLISQSSREQGPCSLDSPDTHLGIDLIEVSTEGKKGCILYRPTACYLCPRCGCIHWLPRWGFQKSHTSIHLPVF